MIWKLPETTLSLTMRWNSKNECRILGEIFLGLPSLWQIIGTDLGPPQHWQLVLYCISYADMNPSDDMLSF